MYTDVKAFGFLLNSGSVNTKQNCLSKHEIPSKQKTLMHALLTSAKRRTCA